MPERSTTLRDMILEAKDNGSSYRALAARAIDPETGTTASYGLINNIVLGKNEYSPKPVHLRAIAAALGVPYEKVRQAAIAQWLPAESATASAPKPDPLRKEVADMRALAARLLDQADEIAEELDGRRGPQSA